MSQYVLDTDHVSLFLRRNESVRNRLARSSFEVSTTIVTAQELFNGWVTRINAPSQADNLVEIYTRFWEVVGVLRVVEVLNFDDGANRVYQRLLQEHPSLRKSRIQKDVRIASVALSVGGIVVTRNQRDFSQIPGLQLEDWTL
jgi:tRNA(fMet)-specific endonuclease VapC